MLQPCKTTVDLLNRGLFAVIAMIAFLAPVSLYAEDTIPQEVIAVFPKDFAPYYVTDEKGRTGGFAIEVFEQVAKRADLKVRYRPMETWGEAIDAIKSGQAHVIPNLGDTGERRKFASFTASMNTLRISLFTTINHFDLVTLDDLAGRKVAVVRINAALNILKQHKNIGLEIYETLDDALTALLENKVDALAYPESVLRSIARQKNATEKIRKFGGPLKQVHRAIAVRKDLTELHQRLNQTLQEFIITREFDEIYRKWFGSPLQSKRPVFDKWWLGYAFAIVIAALSILMHLKQRQKRQAINGGRSVNLEQLYDDRKRILLLVLLMAGVAVSVSGISLMALYNTSLEEEKSRLAESATSHARLIEAIARFNNKYSTGFPLGPTEATLSQIREGLAPLSGSTELTIGRRIGDTISFVMRQKAAQTYEPAPVPFDAEIAEPMRLALSGKTGTVIGLDYRNIKVLAAHVPIGVVNFGIVVKMDMDEIRRPFIDAGLMAGGFGISIIFIGVIVFYKISNPILRKISDNERRLRTILDTSPAPLTITRLSDSLFKYANKAAGQLFGMPAIDLIGYSAKKLYVNPDDRKAMTAVLQKEGEIANYEVLLKKHDGTPICVHINGRLSEFEGEKVLIAGFLDISDLKKLEATLRQAQKMEAIGHLTSGIAHDFNNLLGIIMGNLELLRRKMTDDPKALEYVDAAYGGSERGVNITGKLLNFSRDEPGDTKFVNVNEVIKDMLGLVSKSVTVAIKFETHLAEDIWSVKIEPGNFEDSLLNLSLNARDAMPDGGALIIESANKFLDERYVQLNPGSTVGENVMVSFSDTGTGMTPEVAEQAFQPFFTTKEKGRGTGLGLSMVYGFVHRSSGHIKIYTEPGEGTTLRMYLPRAVGENESIEAEEAAVNEELPRGDEIVLLVEDEENLLKVAVSFLELLGYRTLTALNGKQALQMLKEHPEIDLLFSDVVMPGGVSGYALGTQVMKTYPGIKILLTSGFTSKREKTINGDKPLIKKLSSNLLSKPYNQSELARAVRRTLDEESET